MLLGIREAKSGRQHKLGRAQHADEVNTRPKPSEELEPVQIDDNPKHLAYIGSRLVEDLKHPLIHFLKHNKDVFAWKQEDMGGIDPANIHS